MVRWTQCYTEIGGADNGRPRKMVKRSVSDQFEMSVQDMRCNFVHAVVRQKTIMIACTSFNIDDACA